MEFLSRWAKSSRVVALALTERGELRWQNPVFERLNAAGEDWRWLNGPHAHVRYASLGELVLAESATLAPAVYLSRFERDRQVIEVRLERLDGGALALIHDVTADLRRQRELQRDREALLHQERMHAMGVLASGVAHDLNHVLNIIALRVATLRADPLLTGAQRTLEGLARVVRDAAGIVARLQDLARKRRDRPNDPLDLAAVLTGAVEMARSEVDPGRDAHGVYIRADVPPLPLVRGSAAELAHVFGSLLLHAREQLENGGIVQVRARAERHRVVVTIRESGGLPDQDLSRLFDPFSGATGESALGLSVAWGVMTRLGGSLSAQSRPGEGTSFTLTFPLAAPAPPPRPALPEPAPQQRRLLLIDDEADNLELLREVLEMEGQEVVAERSGPAALARIGHGERFDAVVCDVSMPEMSGWQVAREIRRLAPGTPVWLLTGWANEIADDDPRRELVQGVLAKPVDIDRLRALLWGSPRASPPAGAASGL